MTNKAIANLKNMKYICGITDNRGRGHGIFFVNESDKVWIEEAIKALEQMDALDKIRAEIDEKAHHFLALHNTQRVEGLEDALNIIDKYTKESEDKDD